MRLYYAPTSPYARIVRSALIDSGLADGIDQRLATLRDPESELLPYNKVGRVPTLILDDGTVLTETFAILLWIDTRRAGADLVPRDDWASVSRLGAAMGFLDGIAVWNRELRRPVDERSPGVLALEETRAARTANALDAGIGAWNGRLDAAAIALCAALGYLERRHKVWDWRTGRAGLSAWYDRVAALPCMAATTPAMA